MGKAIQINFKDLSTVPIDVRKVIQKEQRKEMDKKGVGKYSVALTICKIVREWAKNCQEH